MYEQVHSQCTKMKQMIFPLFPFVDQAKSYGPSSRFTDISYFHPKTSAEFDATVDVIREIYFSYEVVFPVVIVDGWSWTPGNSFCYGWQQMESRSGVRGRWYYFTEIYRLSVLLFHLISSVLLCCVSSEDWKDNILPNQVSFRHRVFLPRPVYSTPFYELFLVCSTSMRLPPFPPPPFSSPIHDHLSWSRCTLVIRYGKGIWAQTWFRVMSWLKE